MLSLETGYKRDYGESVAYREGFSHDRLMFRVSKTDDRLRNKAEVLVMQLPDSAQPDRRVPVAIETRSLERHQVHTFTAAHARFVVVTSKNGANRVYRSDERFPDQPGGPMIVDVDGRRWNVTESALVLARDPAVRRPRVAAQRAFWFGWYAQFPDTTLIK